MNGFGGASFIGAATVVWIGVVFFAWKVLGSRWKGISMDRAEYIVLFLLLAISIVLAFFTED